MMVLKLHSEYIFAYVCLGYIIQLNKSASVPVSETACSPLLFLSEDLGFYDQNFFYS